MLIDWQSVGVGRAAWEVCYFLNFSTSGNDWEADQRYYRAYYDSLCSSARDNPNFDRGDYTFRIFLGEIFAAWAQLTARQVTYLSYCGWLYPVRQLRSYLLKAGDSKNAYVIDLFVTAWDRLLQRMTMYHHHGAFQLLEEVATAEHAKCPLSASYPAEAPRSRL
jgi:hypothetical protein